MARIAKVYRELWGITGNPFPDHAIASAGDRSKPFYEQLHPCVAPRMARAFLGTHGAPPPVAFLWSLGAREETRGYGKTRLLLWLSGGINHEYGRSMARLAGPDD